MPGPNVQIPGVTDMLKYKYARFKCSTSIIITYGGGNQSCMVWWKNWIENVNRPFLTKVHELCSKKNTENKLKLTENHRRRRMLTTYSRIVSRCSIRKHINEVITRGSKTVISIKSYRYYNMKNSHDIICALPMHHRGLISPGTRPMSRWCAIPPRFFCYLPTNGSKYSIFFFPSSRRIQFNGSKFDTSTISRLNVVGKKMKKKINNHTCAMPRHRHPVEKKKRVFAKSNSSIRVSRRKTVCALRRKPSDRVSAYDVI